MPIDCSYILDDSWQNLLTNQLGLVALFNLTYAVEDIDLRQILHGVPRRVFEAPAFETIRTNGTDEKSLTRQNVRVEAQPLWASPVDVLLDACIDQVESKATDERIRRTYSTRVGWCGPNRGTENCWRRSIHRVVGSLLMAPHHERGGFQSHPSASGICLRAPPR